MITDDKLDVLALEAMGNFLLENGWRIDRFGSDSSTIQCYNTIDNNYRATISAEDGCFDVSRRILGVFVKVENSRRRHYDDTTKKSRWPRSPLIERKDFPYVNPRSFDQVKAYIEWAGTSRNIEDGRSGSAYGHC